MDLQAVAIYPPAMDQHAYYYTIPLLLLATIPLLLLASLPGSHIISHRWKDSQPSWLQSCCSLPACHNLTLYLVLLAHTLLPWAWAWACD